MYEETSFPFPSEIVRSTAGLSMDFGGSILKVIYRSKENKKEIESSDAKFGHLQLISFPRSDWEKALEYLKEKADITREGDELPTIFTTGFGCTNHGKAICETLSVTLEQVSEFDGFVKGFQYLTSNLSRSDFLEPFQIEAAGQAIPSAKGLLQIMEHLQLVARAIPCNSNEVSFDAPSYNSQVKSQPSDSLSMAESEDIYPCILAMCGSAFGYFQLNKDKSYNVLDVSYTGGKSFYAIGRLITDCETFEELIELASQGNLGQLDDYSHDIIKISGATHGDDSFYSKLLEANSYLIFCFGKCAGTEKKENFKREDLARAWLQYYIIDLCAAVHLLCLATGLRRVFFCGSFTNTELVRKMVTTEMGRRNFTSEFFGVANYQPFFDFIKPGAHLGAIGAMIDRLVE